jgi:peptidoglycan/LPS O-acetylase OafA/YrhL
MGGNPADLTVPMLKPEPPQHGTRFLFIDGLRGVAALMVLTFHFTVAKTPRSYPFIHPLPSWLYTTLDDGKLGVDIFFVISGFVIAYSQRGTIVTGKYFLNFVLQRSFRLDPPYWFTIFLEITLLIVWRRAFHVMHPIPSIGKVLSHLIYAQHLLRYGDIVSVFWTLCLEVQFYIIFTVFRGIAQYAREGPLRNGIEGGLMTLLAVASLAIFGEWIPNPPTGFFMHFWFMFFMGVAVWWAIGTPQRKAYFIGMMALACLAMVLRFDTAILLVVLTAGAVYSAAKFDKMGTWLSNPVIQFLGMISYSLYLVHDPIGLRIINKTGPRFTGASIGAKLMWIALATAVSISAATVMYLLIERPSMRLSKRLLKNNWKKRTEPAHLTTVE